MVLQQNCQSDIPVGSEKAAPRLESLQSRSDFHSKIARHFQCRVRVVRPQRGYILVQALVVLAGLLALLAMLAADGRVSNQTIQNRLRQRRAEAANDAALARALSAIEAANPAVVTLSDDWAKLGDGGGEQFTLDGSTFRVEIVDTAALVNLNSAPEEQLGRLPLTPQQVHALLDWRESKAQARSDGAKDAYYHTLPIPYNAALEPLATTDELLLVKDWTAQTLYQTPTAVGQSLTDTEGRTLPLAAMLTADGGVANTQADGSPRINLGQPGVAPNALIQAGIRPDLAMQIASQAPFTSWSALLTLPGIDTQTSSQLLDTVTFTDNKRLEGKTNLNTVPLAVLQTLPNVTPALASAIAARQSKGFRHLSDLANVSGVDSARLAQIADSFTVGSDTWLVRAYGRSGGVGVATEAVVGLRTGRVQVITQTRLSTTGIPSWWGWETEPTSTGDAGDAL